MWISPLSEYLMALEMRLLMTSFILLGSALTIGAVLGQEWVSLRFFCLANGLRLAMMASMVGQSSIFSVLIVREFDSALAIWSKSLTSVTSCWLEAWSCWMGSVIFLGTGPYAPVLISSKYPRMAVTGFLSSWVAMYTNSSLSLSSFLRFLFAFLRS